VNSGVTDSRLLGWAILKLRALKSQKAEAEVQRYSKEIDDLPDGSPMKNALQRVQILIRGIK
jgi:hypothetical protein